MTGSHRSGPRGPRKPLNRCTALALLLLPLPGLSLSWEFVPQIGVGTSYETNPNYSSGSEDGGFSGNVSASVTINGETQRSSLKFSPRANSSFVTGTENDEDLNTFDYFLPVSASWSQERATYGIDAGYSYITTNDYEVTDPNNPLPGGQFGRIVVNDDQQQLYAGPYANFQVTARDALGVSFSVSNYDYDDAELTLRSNYDSASARTTWTRSLNPKSAIVAGADVSWFEAERPGRSLAPAELPFIFPSLICPGELGQFVLCAVDNETWSYGADVGYRYTLTPTSTIGVTAGVAHSEIEISGPSAVDADEDPGTPDLPCFDLDQQSFVTCTLQTSDETFIGRLFYDQRTGNTITMGFSIARSIQPSSDGAQVVSDLASAYLSKQFSDRVSGTLGANFTRQEAVGAETDEGLAARFNTEYARLDARLSWQLTRNWSASTNYSYSKDEQRSGFTYDAENHTIGVFLQYTGLGNR